MKNLIKTIFDAIRPFVVATPWVASVTVTARQGRATTHKYMKKGPVPFLRVSLRAITKVVIARAKPVAISILLITSVPIVYIVYSPNSPNSLFTRCLRNFAQRLRNFAQELNILDRTLNILDRPLNILDRPLNNDVWPLNNDVWPLNNDVLPLNNDVLPLNNDVLPLNNDVLPLNNDVLALLGLKSEYNWPFVGQRP